LVKTETTSRARESNDVTSGKVSSNAGLQIRQPPDRKSTRISSPIVAGTAPASALPLSQDVAGHSIARQWAVAPHRRRSDELMDSAFPDQADLLVDTHVHTHYSDGTAGVPRIERFCRNRGLGLSVTDHNEIRGATSLCLREQTPVIPGIEVGTEEGIDLLDYLAAAEALESYFRDAVEPYLRTRYMVRSWIKTPRCLAVAREMGAYISLAHPFALGRKSLDYQQGRHGASFVDTIMNGVDAIELHNGGVHRQANLKAKKYAVTAGKRLTVGSDSHRLGTIGSCGTYLATKNGCSPDALFESLKSADDLQFKMKRAASAAHLPMLGIIALKHTHHFVRAGLWGHGA
jgi:predicted metal-dependent phosphoesterase TrpH